MLDLGFFNSLQSITDYGISNTIYHLITVFYDEFDKSETSNISGNFISYKNACNAYFEIQSEIYIFYLIYREPTPISTI